MAKKNTVEIVINADDRASKKIHGVKGALSGLKRGLGTVAKGAMIGFGALAAGAAAAGAGILKLATDAAKIEPIERDFGRLADSIGETTDTMLRDMRQASYGMVADADLMQSANRLISMGLAESAEEAGGLTRMAVRLGEAMGKGPTEAMEEFALMMANQSIPRLDTFGISAGKVRTRIAELMAANEELTREEAFAIAVREEGTKSLDRIGEGGKGAAADMARLQASIANIKNAIGKAFIPILAALLEPLGQLAQKYGPQVIEWAEQLATWLETRAIPAVSAFATQLFEGLGRALEFIQYLLGAGTIQDAFYRLQEAIEDVAPQWVVDAVGALGEAIGQVASFVKKNAEPILIGLATAIGTVVIPAFAAWAAGAVAAAAGTIAALAPVLLPLAAIAAAVAALVIAWENDWLGIRTYLTEVWETTLKPIFDSIVEWLSVNIPAAMAAVVAFWNDSLKPTLMAIWEWLNTWVKPAVEAVARVIGELVRIAFEALWIIITEKIVPAVEDVWSWLTEKLSPAISAVKTVVDPLNTALGILQGFLAGIAKVGNTAADALSGIHASDAFTPGSPTPFELGIRGATDALKEAAKASLDFGSANVHAPGLGGLSPAAATATGTSRTVVLAPIMLDSRQYRDTRGDVNMPLVAKLLESIEAGL